MPTRILPHAAGLAAAEIQFLMALARKETSSAAIGRLRSSAGLKLAKRTSAATQAADVRACPAISLSSAKPVFRSNQMFDYLQHERLAEYDQTE